MRPPKTEKQFSKVIAQIYRKKLVAFDLVGGMFGPVGNFFAHVSDLRPFTKIGYARVLFLDSDIILRSNIDYMFQYTNFSCAR